MQIRAGKSRSYATVAVCALASGLLMAGAPSSADPARTSLKAAPVAGVAAVPVSLRLTDAHSHRFQAQQGGDYAFLVQLSEFHVPPSTKPAKLVLTASVQARTSRGDRGRFGVGVRPAKPEGGVWSLRPGDYAVDAPNGSTTSFVWTGTVPPSTSGYSVVVSAQALSEGEGDHREARLYGRRWAAVLDVTPVP